MQAVRLRRLLLLAGASAALAPLARSAPKEREIRIVARRFVFEPATLNVAAGTPLVLRFTAPEVPMGFNLPDYGVRTDIVPGQEAVLRFTATRTGRFTFLCDVFCGNGHETMNGELVVT